jgi:predicted TIM-barrel fold metal-dependent hydrolase
LTDDFRGLTIGALAEEVDMKPIEKLREYVFSLPLIDTHEHLPSREELRDRDTDVLKEYLAHYYNRDLISAGLPRRDYTRILEEKLPIREKWRLVEPYWEVARHTGYGRALDIAVRGLYGIDGISGKTIEDLDARFHDSLQPGHFRRVLRDRCRIERSLLCVETLEEEHDPLIERSVHCDRELFVPVYSVNLLVHPESWAEVERLERESAVRITSFSSWLEAAEANIAKACSLGSPILKNSLAYVRSLYYERVSRAEAEEAFKAIFATRHFPDWHQKPIITGKAFQDYLFRFILEIASRKKLVVQIHTGIQEGSGNLLSNSNPEALGNLFLEYPDVDFDLFHIGYPYQNLLTVLAKNFPNVYIDMCWAHIVSPNASVQALVEWVDTVPLNKISAFGGDYLFVDGVYGHQVLAREDVATALSVKVEEGLFDVGEACRIARLFLYENPKRIFRLGELKASAP